MKTFQNIIFILATTLFLQGCIASKPNNSRKSLSSSVKNTNSTTTPTFNSDEALYWFTSLKITGTITFNKNTDSIAYLRGQNVHNFLTSKDSSGVAYYQNGKQFCVAANYNGYKQVRLRAVPIFISNYTTKSIERLFRIDIPSKQENEDTCKFGTIKDVPASAAVFSLDKICDNCLATTLITSESLTLFEVNVKTGASQVIAPSTFSLDPVKLRVDMQSNSTSNESACSNSACEAKGFDCCVEGQCVKDASLKTSASSDPTYQQAMNDYALNPMSFLNYPHIFNICSNFAHNPPPVTTPGNTPQSDAEKRVAQYLSDYKCIDKFLSEGVYSDCLPGGVESSYDDTKKRLAIACGCPTGLTANEMAIKCPDWGVRPLYKSSVQTVANIIDFYCYTPTPENPIGTITNLNVNVSSRSAPHRFYSKTGVNYDDIGKLSSSIEQEGEEFLYLDNLNKSAPVNGSFNVNSILGQMIVGLGQSQPAKMVNVELGKTYIVSATSGYFTPCSQCEKDSWFKSFTAHPATVGGNGLVASGYTTSRDTYGANTTSGNYEDTKFGRACYVPVTMLPLSHKKESDLQTQRMNRLQTQAAYYVNGYQKDWYGFNKGALIGSFDGVTWFAIGSGRRISATSTKLYLAINGAYLDLADRTDTVVNIIPDISANVAPDYDFDPTLAMNDPKQNKAGSCQQYHQCSTDSDCVAQLGWEYMCADVSQMRTNWPIYDTDAKEVTNQMKTGTIFEILQGTVTPGNSTKRCVYRGAGAPCVRDFTALNDNFNQKNLTCAPNFYCAALTSNRFNDELARSPKEMDNILFGMDANVLGRPLKYVTANKGLTAATIANIKSNGSTIGLTSPQVDDMGICRPGKAISGTAASTHSNADSARRTDYISQIASCGSTITNASRVSSCPAFNDDGDYLAYNSTVPWPDDYKRQQNSCGAEARDANNDLSAFRSIEGGSLQVLGIISQPILAADACLRRAGSVCNTDLDCGPNKLHEDIAGSMALSYFGGTEAEQSYWKESLVCGQGAAIPQFGSANYYDYKLSANRCCREVGKDFTMYTSGPATIVPENMGSNVNLVTSRQSIDNPKANYRYSRYTVSKTANLDVTTIPSVTATAEPKKEQWKVINETGTNNCCGGGWVRKFADGTHNWKITNRLNLETSNFSCLNYRSPLMDPSYNGFGNAKDKIIQSSYQREYEYFCKFPSNDGCMQILYRDITDMALLPPTPYNPVYNEQLEDDNTDIAAWTTAAPYLATGAYQPKPASGYTRMQTTPDGDLESGNYGYRLNSDVPYVPFAFTFTSPPYDQYQYPDSGKKEALRFFIDKDLDPGVSLYLPAYIPYDTTTKDTPTIGAVYIKYVYEDERVEVVNITHLKNQAACDNVTNYSGGGQPVDAFAAGDFEAWCVSHNTKTQNRPVMHFKAYTGAVVARQWKYASVIIDFMPLERYKNIPVAQPGNMYYYLTKLGRLELIGIPQITYEPIYCNNNQNNLVPGIFTSTLKTRSDFQSASQAYTSFEPIISYAEEGISENDVTAGYGNPNKRFTYQDKLGHQAIFSSKEFACCTPLGKETASEGKCCSGTAATVNGKLICKLPTGANLNVYFNKFVSSEGVGEDLPGNGLTLESDNPDDVDFHEFTGEPKLRSRTNDKIMALGKAFCKSGIVGQGGSFGRFGPEPSGTYELFPGSSAKPFPFSFVDSIMDRDDDNFAGKMLFDAGFRWDHHFYCK